MADIMIYPNHNLIHQTCNFFFEALTIQDFIKAAQTLRELSQYSIFPENWLLKEADALEQNNFLELSELFQSGGFYGPDGDFLIVGPYTCTEGSQSTMLLSALWGQQITLSNEALEDLEELISKVFGCVSQPVLRVHSFHKYRGSGHFKGNQGLPFIAPNNWAFSQGDGMVLNDVTSQQGRFLVDVHQIAPRVFAPPTADLILSLLDDTHQVQYLQQLEYQFHEAGHASGLGLTYKLRNQLLPGYWFGAVEDWRADGVEFEIMSRRVTQGKLSEIEAGQVAAIYLGIKLCTDAFRQGGPDSDYDVNAAILTLDRLLEGGGIRLNGQGLLELTDPSYPSLLRALQAQRNDAVTLTHRELALSNPLGLLHLYGSVPLSQSTRAIFHSLLERCQPIS